MPTITLSEHFGYRKLLRFTLPTIAMMIFTSIYSVVDGGRLPRPVAKQVQLTGKLFFLLKN